MLDEAVEISKNLTVGPQPSKKELVEIARDGYKTIINLSQKREHGQPYSPDEEERLVERLGMEYIHMPLSLSSMKASHADQFCEEITTSEKPVYIHCRLGQRSVPLSLIHHARKKRMSAETVLLKANDLGISWNAPYIGEFVVRNLQD